MRVVNITTRGAASAQLHIPPHQKNIIIMLESKEKKLFDIAIRLHSVHGEIIDDVTIITFEEIGIETVKIFCSDGFSWEVKKEFACDPFDVCDHDGADADGYSYEFTEPWSDFKESGIDCAINKLFPYENA